MNKFLASSANPEKLSLTIRGILVGLVPIVLLVSGAMNIQMAQVELTELIDSVVRVVITITAALSAVMTAYGFIRKIVLKFGKK